MDTNYEIVYHEGVLTVAVHKVKVIWLATDYYYNGSVRDVRVELEDETGHRMSCDVQTTDLDGNPKEFREVGDYIATVILGSDLVLDPDDTGGLSKEVTIHSVDTQLNFALIALILLLLLLLVLLIVGLRRRQIKNKV